jgi:type II secretory pathway pseudopilin PulG
MRIANQKHLNSVIRRRAFTLIEAMAAASIMLLLMLALFGGISYGFSVTRISRENLRATQIILEKMEGIRLYTYDQIVSSNMFPTTFTDTYYPSISSTNESVGITYYGQFAVSDPGTGTGYNSNIKLVTVTVSWTNSFGTSSIARSRQMQTMIARYGIQNYSFFN